MSSKYYDVIQGETTPPVHDWRFGDALSPYLDTGSGTAQNLVKFHGSTGGAPLVATDPDNDCAISSGGGAARKQGTGLLADLAPAAVGSLEILFNADSTVVGSNLIAGYQLDASNYYQLRIITPGDLLDATWVVGGVQSHRVSAFSIRLGSTYHAVATFNGSAVSLYINGLESGAASGVAGSVMVDDWLTVGSTGGAGSSYAGRVDEWSIWSQQLTSAQALAHYRAAAIKNHTWSSVPGMGIN